MLEHLTGYLSAYALWYYYKLEVVYDKYDLKHTMTIRVFLDDQPHWDWDTAQTPTGGSSGESRTMGESLIRQYGVSEEGQRSL